MDPIKNLQPAEAASEGLTPAHGWQKTFAAFRRANYRYFYMGQTASLIGTWARTSALGWLAFQITHSEFLLGMVSVLNSLPIFLFAIYSGSLADRFPKIRIFTLTSWFALLSSLLLAVFLWRGPVDINTLLIFSACWGIATAFEMPARQTLMVELVGKKDLINAIALNSAMVNSTRVVGPAIGGLLYAAFGPVWCFFLDAMSFLAVLFGIYKIQLPPEHYRPKKTTTGLKYILEGFKYLKTNRLMAQAVALLAIMGVGGWAYLSQLPAFVHTQLHMDVQGYGWLLAMNGLGACTSALLVATQGAKLVNVRTLYTGIVLFSLFIILMGWMANPIGVAFMIYFAGFGIILFFSIGNSIVQTQSPDHLRGRLMGIWALVFGGGMPFGSFWMGLLASHTSSGFALQMGGLFCALGALTVYFLFKGKRV
jgi:MFS family permease